MKSRFHRRINQYFVTKVIGVGSQSKVMLAESRESGKKYAIKTIKQRRMSVSSTSQTGNGSYNKIISELDILRNLSH